METTERRRLADNILQIIQLILLRLLSFDLVPTLSKSNLTDSQNMIFKTDTVISEISFSGIQDFVSFPLINSPTDNFDTVIIPRKLLQTAIGINSTFYFSFKSILIFCFRFIKRYLYILFKKFGQLLSCTIVRYIYAS